MKEEKIYLYGRHALKEVLETKPQAVRKVFLDKNAGADTELKALLAKAIITPSMMKGEDKSIASDAVHQGVIALITPEKLYTPLEDALHAIKDIQNPCVVLLDELHDPHNVGAIIRSAAAFGASMILLPEHNQSPITGTVIKTSAGMVFRIPIVQIGNVNQMVRKLKDSHGFWVYGLVMDGDTKLRDAAFDTPTLFVVGNESSGIREKTLELCDVKLSIPMQPGCESLNASVAASVVMYEYWRNK